MTDYNIDFKDHVVQHPNRFRQVQVSPGVVDLIPTWLENPSEVIEAGTPVNADLFDKLRANVTRRSETFAATAGQTVFNLTKAYLVDQGRIDVYISGIKQRSGVDFTETSPTSFTLSGGLDAGTIVEAVYFSASQALSEDLIEQVQAAEASTIAANEATANAIDATEGALTANLNWKEPVNNLTELNALSNPQIRDTRQTRDTGNVYRYDGSAWVLIQTMDPNAINALDTRLTTQLAEKASKMDFDDATNQINSQLSEKASKDDLQQISLAYKESYATLTALQTAYPSGNLNNHVVLADGMIYTWDGTSWVNTQVQANGTGIADGSITAKKLSGDIPKLQEDYVSLRSGSIAYYGNRAADAKWYSENSDKDITLYNFADYSTPLTFNGTLKTHGIVTYTLTDVFTAFIKLRATTFGTTRRLLSFFGSGGFEVALNSTGGILLSPGGVATTASLNLNQDYVIGISVNNTTKKLRLFIDGVLNGEYVLASNTAFSGRNLYLGRNANSDNSYFEGILYKLSMFNVALNDVEMVNETNAMTEDSGVLLINRNNLTTPLATDKILHGTQLLNDYLENSPSPTTEQSKKFMHISADDVIEIFRDLTVNNRASIFDNPQLGFLKQMHDEYGLVFSGYIFYELVDGSFNMSMVPSTWAAEFRANAHWLKFGYHWLKNADNFLSVDAATGLNYYNTGIAELFRICGGFESIDTVPRFHNYAAPLATVQAIQKVNLGIEGFLTSEDSRANYHLTTEQNNYMKTHDRLMDYGNNVKLFSTDLRLENTTDAYATLTSRITDIAYGGRMNDIIIFTHEQYLVQTTMQEKIEACCQFARDNGYRFDFPMHHL